MNLRSNRHQSQRNVSTPQKSKQKGSIKKPVQASKPTQPQPAKKPTVTRKPSVKISKPKGEIEKEKRLLEQIQEKEKELSNLKSQLSKIQTTRDAKENEKLPEKVPQKEKQILKIDVLGSSIAKPIEVSNIKCNGKEVKASLSAHPGATIESLNRKLATRNMNQEKDITVSYTHLTLPTKA